MANWRGIEYFEEAKGGPSETWGVDESRVIRTLLFFGADRNSGPTFPLRQAIAENFIGKPNYTIAGGKKCITRLTPHFYPSGGSTNYLYCTRILNSEMVGRPLTPHSPAKTAVGDKIALYPCWRVTFEYRMLPYDIREDNEVKAVAGELYVSATEAYPDEGDALRVGWTGTRYISRIVRPSGRVLSLRQGVLKYEGVTDGSGRVVPTLEPFPFNETSCRVEYRWVQVPISAYPAATVQTYLNTVNDATFDGYTTGTLLFLDADIVPRRDPFGQRTVDVVYRMLWSPRHNGTTALGHNAIPRIHAGGVTYTLVNTSGTAGETAKRPYRYTSFVNLFHPVQ